MRLEGTGKFPIASVAEGRRHHRPITNRRLVLHLHDAKIIYEQFAQGDFRRSLSWKGRFAGIRNAVNFYSPSEDVLENPTLRGTGGAWAKQELFKGVSIWKVVNGLHIENVNVACEGGWGINPHFAVRPDCYLPLKGFFGSRFNDYTNGVVRPLFTPFTDATLHRNGFDSRVDDVLRARMLGDAIPAESFAAGVNSIPIRESFKHP